jgi:hypothetical protein
MAKPISTQVHGIFDYISVPTLLALPRILNWNKKITNLLTGVALGTLGTSLMTRYELGIFKVIPMPGHLAIDIASASTVAAAPFLLLNETERDSTLIALLTGIGISEIMIALLTRTQPSFDSDNALGVVIEKARETVGAGQ